MKSPYIGKEKEIAEYLIKAWNLFTELERQHPCELDDFANGIHQCQNILGFRTLRRDYPETYPIKMDKCLTED